MNKSILIVDDEKSIRDLCKEFLEQEGFKVDLAVDGQDALDKMEYKEFFLYIVDIAMPRINGLELMKIILKRQPSAIVIILTGFSSIEGAVKAVKSGAYKYIPKPIQADELISAVKKGYKYSELTEESVKKSFEPGTAQAPNNLELLLNGFTKDEKNEFMGVGNIKRYFNDEHIPMNSDNTTYIIIVESGKISVWYKNVLVDYLHKWDVWGEENFILAGSTFTKLKAESEVKIRVFERKQLISFFSYKNERLLKQFMINITNCLFFKWRKSLQRNIKNKNEIEE